MIQSFRGSVHGSILKPTSHRKHMNGTGTKVYSESGRLRPEPSVSDLAKIGSVAVDVLAEEAVEMAAEASRAQAEQLKILSKLPSNPVQVMGELAGDVSSRFLTLQEVTSRTTTTVERILLRVDEELSSQEIEEVVDENAVPELPDYQEVLDDLRADVASTRASVRRIAAIEP